MCKILAIIVQVPCITFLARLAEYVQELSNKSCKCKGYVTFLAHFLHNMQESCTSNSARNVLQDICQQDFNIIPCKTKNASFLQGKCTFLARYLHEMCTHILQRTKLKLHVSCKDMYSYCTLLARFVHEMCHISCKERCSNCTFLASILHVVSACILHISCKDCISEIIIKY